MKEEIKLDCLHTFMTENIDILPWTELNTTSDYLEYKDQLPARTCIWWEANHWSMSHNKQDTHGDDFQLGGTALLIMNKLSHKMMKLEDDTSGLGRWCWAWLCRKENHFLWVVSVYQPCKADSHLTMYQQCVRWFTRQGKNMPFTSNPWRP